MKTLLLIVVLCVWFTEIELRASASLPPKKEVWITVFVHGIMSIKPHISFSNFLRFMTDDVQNTIYSRTVEIMRNDPLFYQNQAMQEIGLKRICTNPLHKGNTSGILAMVFEDLAHFAHPSDDTKNYYYTYGWTGLLSPAQRLDDATLFYNELSAELQRLKREEHIEPKVRIIGYSHGGNICLNLAAVRRAKDTLLFHVDELFLLGMPVQSETDYLVNDPLFKKIYHIYSRGDRIQKLDFFSFNRFFSRRIFKSRKDFKVPEKLVQIQIKCTRNTRFRSQEKMKGAYNFKSNALVGGKSCFLRNACPGHTELWFFSWTPANYRHNFPLNPLPLVALIPLLVQALHYFEEYHLFQKPTLIDIRPEHEIILIKNQKTHDIITVIPFLSQEEFGSLKRKVYSYAPENYTACEYMSHIQRAYNQAQEEYSKKNLKTK